MKNFGRFHFKEVGEHERMVSVIHRHWFDILKQYLAVVAIGIFMGVVFFVFPEYFMEFKTQNAYTLFLFIVSAFIILIWLYMSLAWVDYYFDIWIVTTERIINIEQKGVFVRHVSELKLVNIQDITTEVEGIIPTLLNYGNVHIQTAAEENRFVFRNVGDPYHIKGEIMKLQKHAHQKETRDLSEAIREGGNKM